MHTQNQINKRDIPSVVFLLSRSNFTLSLQTHFLVVFNSIHPFTISEIYSPSTTSFCQAFPGKIKLVLSSTQQLYLPHGFFYYQIPLPSFPQALLHKKPYSFCSAICVICILHKFISFFATSSNTCTSSRAIYRSVNQSPHLHMVAMHSCKQTNHRHNIKGAKKFHLTASQHMFPISQYLCFLHIILIFLPPSNNNVICHHHTAINMFLGT